jgi:hemolysin activation/secretion protein
MSCPTREAINGFLRRLGERYLRHGLVAVRIVPEPVAADGTLTIRVDEGRVARLEAPAASMMRPALRWSRRRGAMPVTAAARCRCTTRAPTVTGR